MGLLSYDDILGSQDLACEQVPVPEWGTDGFVFVRGLSGVERGAYEDMMSTLSKRDRYRKSRGLLCSLGICDESGKPIFTADDVDRLSAKSAAPLDRCFDIIFARSGMGTVQSEKLEKNSDATPGEED